MDAAAPLVHPTALVSSEAGLAPDVRIGAFVVIEGNVRIGPGCVIHPRAYLVGPLILGRDNQVHGGAVLGERPQHAQFGDEPTGVEIGDGNTFCSGVTVHRATEAGSRTRIGDGNLFEPGSHVAHDCRVGSRCTLGSSALMAGHCQLADDVCVGAGAAIHQFCRLGRLSVLGPRGVTTKDIPPFIVQEDRNIVTGINEEGMRRRGLSREQIVAMHRIYDIMFLQGLSLPGALALAERDMGPVDVVLELIEFVRQSRRGGINRMRADRQSTPRAAEPAPTPPTQAVSI
jgi:UDP-N-acetylglucosamine acyltransferase